MKEIIAVIRINKVNETKQALIDVGIPAFTATGRVMGRGKGQVHFDILKGAEAGHPEAIAQLGSAPRLVSKRIVTVVVPEELCKTAADLDNAFWFCQASNRKIRKDKKAKNIRTELN